MKTQKINAPSVSEIPVQDYTSLKSLQHFLALFFSDEVISDEKWYKRQVGDGLSVWACYYQVEHSEG